MASKLGVHINFVRESDEMMQFLLEARPAVALGIDPSVEFWGTVKQEAPEIFLIGRRYFERQPWDDPGRVARAILDMGAAHIMDAWVGLNEPSRGDDAEGVKIAAKLDRDVAILLHREEVEYIAGSWSVGVPDIEDWTLPEMLDALRVADYIGIHQYNAPSMDDPRGIEWWMLRHRIWYPTLPPDAQKPVLITECGIDSGAVHWDPGGQGGWQTFTDEPGYMEQLAWFDGEIREDPYVKGATIYQWGSLDPAWETHDWTPHLVGLMTEYIISQRGGDPPPPDWERMYRECQARVGELEAAIHQIDAITGEVM